MTSTTTIFSLPKEVLEKILGFLPLDKSLLQAAEVHPTWLQVIRSSPSFWKQHYSSKSCPTFAKVHNHTAGRPDEWKVHWAMVKHGVFGKNLLRNVYGMEGMAHWKILSGDISDLSIVDDNEEEFIRSGWSIVPESPSSSLGGGDEGFSFATDQYSCSKEQTVDLWEFGFTLGVMRACLPFAICWGVYISTPPSESNSGGYYNLQIRFLNKNHQDILLDDCPSMTQSHSLPPGLPFTYYGGCYEVKTGKEEYSLVVKNQLRFVHFYHGGMAKGNEVIDLGPRIYCPMVKVRLL